MAERTPIQQSFAFGEMSPRLLGRTYTDRYQQSLRVAENVITLSHGMCVKRPGTTFVGQSPTEGPTDIKLFNMQPDNTQPYIVELGDSYITLWTGEGGFANQTFVAPWLSDEVSEVHAELDPTKAVLVLVHRNHAPQEFILNGPDFEASPPVFQPITFTSPPAEWQLGNYPGTVTFHQNRMWLASTPQQRDTIWGSLIGSFYDFSPATGGGGEVLPTDSIAFQMAERGNIEWIRGARDLLVGADVAEYILFSEGAFLAPGDIGLRQQSAFGCAPFQPADAYNGVLYCNSDLRRIRFQNYQFLEDGWVSLDITWPSEHVTKPKVKELHYQQAPDPLMWLVLEDGTGVTALYERDQDNLVGWHRQPMPNAKILSVALVKNGADVETWFAIERQIDGAPVVYIEKTQAGTISPEPGATPVMSDSTLLRPVQERTLSNGNIQQYIDGMEHLEQETVQVTIEGGAQQVLGLVDVGEVILQTGFAKLGENALVGLQYVGKMQTLPAEQLMDTGTSQAAQKRYSKIFVRVLDSAVPVVNGIVTPSRLPEVPADTTNPQFTGDVQVGNLGWDRFADIEIEMPLARNYNILAIFGEASANTL